MVLARVIAPAQHGEAAAAVGIFALVNCLNCAFCIAHAINLAGDQTPDWTQHWRCGNAIQIFLTILLNLIAFAIGRCDGFESMARLLHISSIGLLLDTPNQMAVAQMRRAMDFALLRKVQIWCTLLTAGVSIFGGLLGWGAMALIIGSNVVHGMPMGIHLLFVKRWKPDGGWWQWPDWKSYRPSLLFGMQLSSSSLLERGRAALESVLLPAAFGFATLGLWNRAQVLLTTTGGRLSSLLVETIYPLLPQSRHHAEQFARHASLFLRGTLLFLIPSAVFIVLQGGPLLLLLYGNSWNEAVPYLPAATVFVAGASVNSLLGFVLLAADRLRVCFFTNLLTSCLSMIALIVAFVRKEPITFAWVAAIGQWLGALLVGGWVVSHLEPNWFRSTILPPFGASMVAAAGSLALSNLPLPAYGRIVDLILQAAVFTVCFGLAMRLLFKPSLASIVHRLPMKGIFIRVFHLREI